VSDEELVLRVIAGEAAVKEMIAAGAPKEYLDASQPLVYLVEELSRRKKPGYVYIRKGDFSLEMRKGELITKGATRTPPVVQVIQIDQDV
jgi:hypothetical protein